MLFRSLFLLLLDLTKVLRLASDLSLQLLDLGRQLKHLLLLLGNSLRRGPIRADLLDLGNKRLHLLFKLLLILSLRLFASFAEFLFLSIKVMDLLLSLLQH